MLEGWKACAGLVLGRQLSNPSGLAGRMVGAAMRIANRLPIQAVIETLNIQPSDRVLDIGCGDGSAIVAMPPAARIVGVDTSDTMVKVARARHRRKSTRGRISVVCGNMMALPFAANSFDKIAASNVLYFCPDVPSFIHECRRVARRGAVLAIYVTEDESMRSWPFASSTTHRHFSASQLENEFARAGVRPEHYTLNPLLFPGAVRGILARIALV